MINPWHNTIVNILLNNVLKRRGLISHEQKWEDSKIVKTSRGKLTVGTEHLWSEEWRIKEG